MAVNFWFQRSPGGKFRLMHCLQKEKNEKLLTVEIKHTCTMYTQLCQESEFS